MADLFSKRGDSQRELLVHNQELPCWFNQCLSGVGLNDSSYLEHLTYVDVIPMEWWCQPAASVKFQQVPYVRCADADCQKT